MKVYKWSAWLIIMFTLVIAVCYFPQEAYPWGSITKAGISFETYQFIIKKAYELLEKDSVFDAKKFPKLEDILAFERIGQVLIRRALPNILSITITRGLGSAQPGTKLVELCA